LYIKHLPLGIFNTISKFLRTKSNDFNNHNNDNNQIVLPCFSLVNDNTVNWHNVKTHLTKNVLQENKIIVNIQ
jgi:hypothetical protein